MCAPSNPDTTRQDATADRMATLSADQFKWVQDQWQADAPTRAAAAARAGEVSDEQLRQMRASGALADESASDYRRIYQPLEESAARDAASYNTEARREQAAGEAVAGVTQSFDAARDSNARTMASQGVNVNDGAYASQNTQLTAAQALGSAGAANRARQQVETVGRAMRQDAIATGRGLVSSQGTQASLALNAGNSSVATAQAPLAVTQGGVQMVQQGAGQAVNGLNAAGNIYARSSQMQADASAASSQASSGLAGAAMTAAAIF